LQMQSGMPMIRPMQQSGPMMQSGFPQQVESPTRALVRCRFSRATRDSRSSLIALERLWLLADATWHADEPHDAKPDGPDVQLRQWNAAVCRE
jgi:hypothetical protein